MREPDNKLFPDDVLISYPFNDSAISKSSGFNTSPLIRVHPIATLIISAEDYFSRAIAGRAEKALSSVNDGHGPLMTSTVRASDPHFRTLNQSHGILLVNSVYERSSLPRDLHKTHAFPSIAAVGRAAEDVHRETWSSFVEDRKCLGIAETSGIVRILREETAGIEFVLR